MGRALLAVSKHVKGVAVGDVVVAPRAIYLIHKAVPHLDFVDARATIYAVFAQAADQQVQALIAEDHVITVATLYPVATAIAVEDVVAAVALYEVAEGGRLVATQASDVVGGVGPYEGVGVGGACASCWAGPGDGESHPGTQADRQGRVAANNSTVLLIPNLPPLGGAESLRGEEPAPLRCTRRQHTGRAALLHPPNEVSLRLLGYYKSAVRCISGL